MSEGKAQVEGKVECLGCILMASLQRVGPDGVQGILEVPLPRTEGEL